MGGRLEGKEVDMRFYGLVSEYDPVPLFDPKSNMLHTFERSLWDRREKEIEKFAKANGFKLVAKTKRYVSYKNERLYSKNC